MAERITMQYDELLELLAAFESSMNAYYSGLERIYDNADLQRLWSKMAQQEETHARLVRLMQKRIESDPDLQQSSLEVNQRNIQVIRDFIDRYKTVLETPDLSLQESFRWALDMESLELDPIYRHFIEKQDKPTQDVLDELLESEDIHLNVLIKAVKKHIDDPEFLDYADEVAALQEQDGE